MECIAVYILQYMYMYDVDACMTCVFITQSTLLHMVYLIYHCGMVAGSCTEVYLRLEKERLYQVHAMTHSQCEN